MPNGFDPTATRRLLQLAIEERDAILDALQTDKNSSETQRVISDWYSGRLEGIFPAGKTTVLIRRLRPRSGYGLFQTAYHQANADAIRADLGSFLLPKLEAVNKAHIALIHEAKDAYERSSKTLGALEKHCHAVTNLIDVIQRCQRQEAGYVPSKPAKRRKSGDEKWRNAQRYMLNMLAKGTLPKTLRQAHKIMKADGFKYDTVRRSAHKSHSLCEHFGLESKEEINAKPNTPGGVGLLNELSGTTARQFQNLPDDTKHAIQSEWKTGDKDKAIELVKVLSADPNAGSTGEVFFIENTDQDSRDDGD